MRKPEDNRKLRRGRAADEKILHRAGQRRSPREVLVRVSPLGGSNSFSINLQGPSMPPSNCRAPPYRSFIATSRFRSPGQAMCGGRLPTLPPKHFKTLINSIGLAAWETRQSSPFADFGGLSQRPTGCLDCHSRSPDRGGLVQAQYCTRIARGEDRRADFKTTAGGALRAISVHGGITGFAADLIIVDDPSDIGDADSRKNSTKSISASTGSFALGLKNQATGRSGCYPAAPSSQ